MANRAMGVGKLASSYIITVPIVQILSQTERGEIVVFQGAFCRQPRFWPTL